MCTPLCHLIVKEVADSAQVAAVSGDVRRALELCRKAAEIAEEQLHCSAVTATSGPGEICMQAWLPWKRRKHM